MADQNGFAYSEVEAIMAKVFDAQRADALPKLRARYKKMRALGFPTGPTPSRGSKHLYDFYQLLEIVLFIDLAEFGMDNIMIEYLFNKTTGPDAQAIRTYFEASFVKLFHPDDAIRSGQTVFFFSPSLMSSRWNDDQDKFRWFIADIGVEVPAAELFVANEGRLCMISLTHLALKLLNAIKTQTPRRENYVNQIIDGYYKQKGALYGN